MRRQTQDIDVKRSESFNFCATKIYEMIGFTVNFFLSQLVADSVVQ